jgi:Tol biopolymer transport system component
MRRRTTTSAVLFVVASCLAGVAEPALAQVIAPPESHSPALSADGRWLAFISTSDDLLEPGGSGADNLVDDAFLLDLQTGDMRLVSQPATGGAANGPTTDVDVSADGRYVAFVSEATNLLATDANGASSDVFVLDTETGALQLASRRGAAGVQGNGTSRNVSISDDGTRVAFVSYASNLVASDTNGQPDAFVRDLTAGTTTRVSTNSSGKEAASATLEATISGNGAIVAFQNTAKLVREDTNGRRDVYVKVLQSGKTQLISVTNREQPANLDSTVADLSRNGRYVVFTSIASNLVGSDTNRVADAFVRDRTGGTTVRVSRNGATEANGATYEAAISPDAAYVAFTTEATNLGGGITDGNGTQLDVFEYELATAALRRVAHDSDGGWPDGPSFDPTYGTSSVIAFTSWATDLAVTDTDPAADVYTRRFAVNRSSLGTIVHRSVSAAA